MDLALDEEVTALESWLSTLDAAANECTAAGSSKFLSLLKAAPLSGGSAVSALAAAAAAIAAASEAAAAADKAAGALPARRGRGGAHSADDMAVDGEEEDAEADAYDAAAAAALAAAAGTDEGEEAPGSSGSPPQSDGTDAGGGRVFSLEAAPQSLTCTGSPASAAEGAGAQPAGSAGSEPGPGDVFHQQLVTAVAAAGCMDEALALDADSANLAVLTGMPWAAAC